MPRRRRGLNPEDEALWQAVARSARPLRPKAAHPPDPDVEAALRPHRLPPEPHVQPADRLTPFRLGERAATRLPHQLAPSLTAALAEQPLRMDAKTHGRMSRGKIAPEARIDLHGMTLSEAHAELVHFLLNAQSAGLRLVLVITGKGKRGADDGPIPNRIGALRHQVPQWLRLPPLGPVVQQAAEAHLRHGGAGAYYVYLRRR